MSQQIMIIGGADGQIELMEDRIIIHRRGVYNLFKHGINAKREIPLLSVTSVNFREAGFFGMGEIDFDFSGRSQLDKAQNKVKFSRKQQANFIALKEKLFDLMQKRR